MGEDVLRIVENQVDTDSDDEAYEMVTTKPKPKWDCETICSTYSNLYNRPKVRYKAFTNFTRTGCQPDIIYIEKVKFVGRVTFPIFIDSRGRFLNTIWETKTKYQRK